MLVLKLVVVVICMKDLSFGWRTLAGERRTTSNHAHLNGTEPSTHGLS